LEQTSLEAVPAIVYARGVTDLTVSEGIKEGGETGDYYMLYGDVALDGALEIIGREVGSQSLDCIVLRLRRGDGFERDCK